MTSEMACIALEMLGLVLGFLGAFGTFAVTLMPQWKVSAIVGSNIIVTEARWEGLWKSCVSRSFDRLYVCVNHKSVLALDTVTGVSRGLMCTACALSVIAFLIAIPGMKCFRCLGNNEPIKSKVLLAAGVLFLLTGIMVLIPVSWFADNIIKEFHCPKVQDCQKHDLGAALYLGWTTSALLISGGGILCSFCRHAKKPRGYISRPSNRGQKPENIQRKPGSVHSYI